MKVVRTDHCVNLDGLDQEFDRLSWSGGHSNAVRIRRFVAVEAARDGAMVANTHSVSRLVLSRPTYRIETISHLRKEASRFRIAEMPLKIGLISAFVGAIIGSILFVVAQ
jgi:hypothetical protein